MSGTIEQVIAKAFSMSDEVWERHTNPLSVWTRYQTQRNQESKESAGRSGRSKSRAHRLSYGYLGIVCRLQERQMPDRKRNLPSIIAVLP